MILPQNYLLFFILQTFCKKNSQKHANLLQLYPKIVLKELLAIYRLKQTIKSYAASKVCITIKEYIMNEEVIHCAEIPHTCHIGMVIPPLLTGSEICFQEARICLEVSQSPIGNQRTAGTAQSSFNVKLSLLIVVQWVAFYSTLFDKLLYIFVSPVQNRQKHLNVVLL